MSQMKRFIPKHLLTVVGLLTTLVYACFFIIFIKGQKTHQFIGVSKALVPNVELNELIKRYSQIQLYLVRRFLYSKFFNTKHKTELSAASIKNLLSINDLKLETSLISQLNIVGVCFLLSGVDLIQLEKNIKFFQSYCSKILLIKNGTIRFSINITEEVKAKNVEIREYYDQSFQEIFVDFLNDFTNSHVIKFDDDDIYLPGSVEQVLALYFNKDCQCVSLKPLIYQFENNSSDTELFLSRRVFFPIAPVKHLYRISGTLMFFSKSREQIQKKFSSKYLDQSLSDLLKPNYIVCTTLSIIVRRLTWRNHASIVAEKLKNNLLKI